MLRTALESTDKVVDKKNNNQAGKQKFSRMTLQKKI